MQTHITLNSTGGCATLTIAASAVPSVLQTLRRSNAKARIGHQAVAARPFNPTSRQLVAGIGLAHLAAQPYGDALGRKVCSFDTSQSFSRWLGSRNCSSVTIFTPLEELTVATLQRWSEASAATGIAIGIIPLREDRPEADAARELAWRLAAPSPGRRVFYSDELRYGWQSPDGLVLGSDQSACLFSPQSSRTELAVVHGHGNSVDMRLGHHILCVQADDCRPTPPGEGERGFPCQHSGPCLREKLASKTFVGAEILAARMTVFQTCTAFVPADGLISSRLSLGWALLRSPAVEVMAGSFRINTVEVSQALLSFVSLSRGLCIGDVTLLMNLLQPGGLGFICFGDPSVALEPSSPGPQDAAVAHSEAQPHSMQGATNEQRLPWRPFQPTARRMQAALIRAAVADAIDHPNQAGLALALDLDAAAVNLCATGDAELDRRLAEFMSLVLADGTYVQRYWPLELQLGPMRDSMALHACGAPLHVANASWNDCTPLRQLWACSRCGMVGETSAGVALPHLFILRPGIMALTVPPVAERAWVAGGMESVGKQAEPAGSVVQVEPGRLCLPISPVRHFPGLRWWSACLVFGGDYLVVRSPVFIEERQYD